MHIKFITLKKLIYIAITLVLSTTSYASEWNNKLYLTGYAGNAKSLIEQSEITNFYSSYDIKDGSIIYKDSNRSLLFGFGYKINDEFSVELKNTDLGSRWIAFEWEAYTPQIQQIFNEMDELKPRTAKGFGLDVNYNYPIGNSFEGYANVGIFNWEDSFSSTNVLNAQKQNRSGNSFKFGVGLRYEIASNLFVRLGVDKYNLSGDGVTNSYLGFDLYPLKSTKYGSFIPVNKNTVIEVVKPIETKRRIAEITTPKTPDLINEVTVHFDFDSAKLSVIAQETIKKLIQSISEKNIISVSVVGHTDLIGTDQYNNKLSIERAYAVLQFMQQQGLSPREISTSGMGSKYPVFESINESNNKMNRRVEIKLLTDN